MGAPDLTGKSETGRTQAPRRGRAVFCAITTVMPQNKGTARGIRPSAVDPARMRSWAEPCYQCKLLHRFLQ